MPGQWCRGRRGVPHRRAITGGPCSWQETGHWEYAGPRWWRPGRRWVVAGRQWACCHAVKCMVCQEYLGPAPECPDRVVECA